MVIRILISFVFASQFTLIFYRDLFEVTKENRLLFLVWGVPCLHLLVNSFLLFLILVGSKYQRHEDFSIVKTSRRFKGICNSTRLRRFFISVKIEDRERILSGLFWSYPSLIVVYKDALGKLKILSFGLLLIRFVWIIINLVVITGIRLILFDLQFSP
jgi:hypothetical protein